MPEINNIERSTTIAQPMVDEQVQSQTDDQVQYTQYQQSATGGYDPRATTASTQQQRPRNAARLSELVRNHNRSYPLSEEGKRYNADLINAVTSSGELPGVKVIPLPNPSNSVAFQYGDGASVIMYEDCIPPTSGVKTDQSASDLMKSFRRNLGDTVNPINITMVSKEDYGRSQQMASAIINNLSFYSNQALGDYVFSLDSLDRQLRIMRDREPIIRWADAYDPHGMPTRNDLVMAVTMPDTDQSNLRPDEQPDQMIYLAVYGYVTFSRVPDEVRNRFGGRGRGRDDYDFKPEVHISNIISPIRDKSTIFLAIALAYHYWIREGNWVHQFDDLDTNNLGVLFTGEDHRPEHFDSFEDRDQAIYQYMDDPVLILDVVDGRDQIFGLGEYALDNPEANARLAQTINTFLGREVVGTDVPLLAYYRTQLVGRASTHRDGNTFRDSRYLDFIRAMHELNPNDIERQMGRIQQLLNSLPAEVELDNIRAVFGQDYVTPLYVNNMIRITKSMWNVVIPSILDHLNIVSVGNSFEGVNTSVLYDYDDVDYVQIQPRGLRRSRYGRSSYGSRGGDRDRYRYTGYSRNRYDR